jgi:hypothetical protein
MNVKDTVANIMTRADADASGDKLDQLLAGLGKLVTRMDALESAKPVVVKADAEPNLTDNKDGEKLDRVLAHLDSLHGKHDELKTSCDSMHAKHDALCSRMDALEDKAKESENVKGMGEPTPVAADAAKGGDELQKGTENETKALETEREENGLKRNDAAPPTSTAVEPSSAMMDSVNSEMGKMREYIARLERSIPKEMPDDERNKFVDAQAKAERIAQAFGDSAGAPRWLNGESLHNYQRRLLSKYKGHSTAWKEKDLARVHDSVLDIAETQIYADAWTAATKPASVEGQPLREIQTSDRTGRVISSFVGDAEACWGPFKLPTRRVTGFTAPPPPPVVIRQH